MRAVISRIRLRCSGSKSLRAKSEPMYCPGVSTKCGSPTIWMSGGESATAPLTTQPVQLRLGPGRNGVTFTCVLSKSGPSAARFSSTIRSKSSGEKAKCVPPPACERGTWMTNPDSNASARRG